MTVETTFGAFISAIFDEFMVAYGDEKMATLGTALLIDRLLDGVMT
jgi:hypothetical protein